MSIIDNTYDTLPKNSVDTAFWNNCIQMLLFPLNHSRME